jgi:hypothetical protein
MKKVLFYIFIAIALNSCVMDTLQRFCIVKNQSNRTIAIYFSNSPTLDIDNFSKQLYDSIFAIKKNSSKDILIQNDILIKETYNNNNKKLYALILDQDSINKYFRLPLSQNIIDKSFLRRQLVDIKYLKQNDTLFYFEEK